MDRIYFDNAATTELDTEVLEAMMPYLTRKYGNPSAIHAYARETRLAIENARKEVARLMNAQPGEIFFTSSATESTNTAIEAAVRDLECTTIITSPIEHHATLYCSERAVKNAQVELKFVELDDKGHVVEESLKSLLGNAPGRCLVTLMHANNEIGNLLKVKNIADICEDYNAILHYDMVQTIGHYPIDLKEFKVHFISCSAHKFHGPKGIGFLYINDEITISPLFLGGNQERNMRAGTENIYGIVGLAKALSLAMERYQEDFEHISSLKRYMIAQLKTYFNDLHFNGDYEGCSLYTVLNVGFPLNEQSEKLLLALDISGVCASGGSACGSGANQGSHVLGTLYPNTPMVPIRFSFSKYNTLEEVDRVIAILQRLLANNEE